MGLSSRAGESCRSLVLAAIQICPGGGVLAGYRERETKIRQQAKPAESRANVLVAMVSLYKAVGGGWVDGIAPVIGDNPDTAAIK